MRNGHFEMRENYTSGKVNIEVIELLDQGRSAVFQFEDGHTEIFGWWQLMEFGKWTRVP